MTRNDPEVLVKLLRAIASSEQAKETKHDVVFEAAAELINAIPDIILEAFRTNNVFLGNVQTLSRRIEELEARAPRYLEGPDWTEVLLKDNPTEWKLWLESNVELGFDEEGNLIGMRVSGDVRKRVSAPATPTRRE